jgi:hypothetical protein
MISQVSKRTQTKTLEEPAATPHRSFEEEAVAIATRLRAEVAAVIVALPEKVSGGTDLDRQLKLGSTNSWRLHSFATAANPMAALEYLPGRATILRLAQAARRKGISPELHERLLEAYDRFESFLQEHAGDRSTLTSMVSAATGDGGAGQIARRRSAFRNNADLWGLQAHTRIYCAIINEGAGPGEQDAVILRGDVDARSLRRGAALQITHRASVAESNKSDASFRERQVPSSDIGVLTEFCSRPTPALTSTIDRTGKKRITKIQSPGIGKSSSLNFFMWEHAPNANEGLPQTNWGLSSLMRLPVSVFIGDLLIRRRWADPKSIAVETYGNLTNMDEGLERRPEDRLPIQEVASHLGSDLDALLTPDVPRYPEMVRHVLREMEWDSAEFDIFRCRVQYPILHTVIDVRVQSAAT